MGLLINKPDGVARCTGVLIAPNAVLTARHCATQTIGDSVICGSSLTTAAVAPENLLATTMGVMPEADRSAYVEASRIELVPVGDDVCGSDLAVVILARNLDATEATPFQPRLDRPAEAGEHFTAVGFGSDGTGSTGQRRVRQDHGVVCVGEACADGEVRATEWRAEDGGYCESDTGAPAIDAGGQVFGVVSRGVAPCEAPILTMTSAWSAWLRDVVRDAAVEGGYVTPGWAGGSTADAGSVDAGLADSGTAPDAASGGAGRGCGCVVANAAAPRVDALVLCVLALAHIRIRRRLAS